MLLLNNLKNKHHHWQGTKIQCASMFIKIKSYPKVIPDKLDNKKPFVFEGIKEHFKASTFLFSF